eukprot:gene19260-6531_t
MCCPRSSRDELKIKTPSSYTGKGSLMVAFATVTSSKLACENE